MLTRKLSWQKVGNDCAVVNQLWARLYFLSVKYFSLDKLPFSLLVENVQTLPSSYSLALHEDFCGLKLLVKWFRVTLCLLLDFNLILWLEIKAVSTQLRSCSIYQNFSLRINSIVKIYTKAPAHLNGYFYGPIVHLHI